MVSSGWIKLIKRSWFIESKMILSVQGPSYWIHQHLAHTSPATVNGSEKTFFTSQRRGDDVIMIEELEKERVECCSLVWVRGKGMNEEKRTRNKSQRRHKLVQSQNSNSQHGARTKKQSSNNITWNGSETSKGCWLLSQPRGR